MFKWRILLLLFCFSPLVSVAGVERKETLLGLEQASRWIMENISFPEGAYKYGFVGTERFVISADWEGRVFITSHLSALNPALEQEIKDVVGRCPKCIVSGAMLGDIYQSVELDFADYVNRNSGVSLIDVGVYASPYFVPSGEKRDSRADSRDVFWKKVSEKVRLPKGQAWDALTNVSVRYFIHEDGSVRDVFIESCDKEIAKILAKAIKRTRGWTSARTKSGDGIPVFVNDSLTVGVSDKGTVLLTRCKDAVLLNSVSAPEDDNTIVLIPDIPAYMIGDYSSVSKILNDSLYVDCPTKYIGSFVVEKDGSVSNLYTDTSNHEVDSLLVALVSGTKWTPAMSGGKPVRSVQRFVGVADAYEYVSGFRTYNPYPDFLSDGKRHNLSYDGRRTKAYKYMVNEYPSLGADIYGYGKFRYFNHNDYIEALMMKGKTPFREVQLRKIRKK